MKILNTLRRKCKTLFKSKTIFRYNEQQLVVSLMKMSVYFIEDCTENRI